MPGLNSFFDRIAAKTLSQVEANPRVSRQHEFNGASSLRALFGEPAERIYIFARHFNMESLEDDAALVTRLSWYNSRVDQFWANGKPRQDEWRLYYTRELVPSLVPGGTLVLAQRDDSYYIFTSGKDTPGEAALRRLFALDGLAPRFTTVDSAELSETHVAIAEGLVLAELGIAPDDQQPLVDRFFAEFGDSFPRGDALSAFVRANTFGIDPLSDPDEALLDWARVELELFNAMETRVETVRMREAETLDEILEIAMSIFQRRRSRAGKAFEYHLRALFDMHGVAYSPNPVTEAREEPDFIFPSIDHYRDPRWPDAWLTMLAAKQTLRDRWRQILREAARIERKHLVTLDTNLSRNQVKEIEGVGIQLVVPYGLIVGYPDDVADRIWSVAQFLELVKSIQAESGAR